MLEKSLLLVLRLNICLLPGSAPNHEKELTTLPHILLSTGEGDAPHTPPNSAPRFRRSAFGALMSPRQFLNHDYASVKQGSVTKLVYNFKIHVRSYIMRLNSNLSKTNILHIGHHSKPMAIYIQQKVYV